MDEYGKRNFLNHAIEAGIIPQLDEEIKSQLSYLVQAEAVLIDIENNTLTMVANKEPLSELDDEGILSLLIACSQVGNSFKDAGWNVEY